MAQMFKVVTVGLLILSVCLFTLLFTHKHLDASKLIQDIYSYHPSVQRNTFYGLSVVSFSGSQ